MALQIDKELTTISGFTVPSGSYCWVQEERGFDKKYSINIRLSFYKDKQSFTDGKGKFIPQDIPEKFFNIYKEYNTNNYMGLTSDDSQSFAKDKLESALGIGTVLIVK